MSGEEKRMAYLEIIEALQTQRKSELGNYYLLFYAGGQILDFDFVSRFQFNLSEDGAPWKVHDLFGTGQALQLYTVKDLQEQVLPPLFNNALVVRRKDKDWIFKWFDEIKPAHHKKPNTFLLMMKYRKAFYDYIYKSQRQGITAEVIREILVTGMLDDLRHDEIQNGYNTESFNIRLKLNLLFSLYQYFQQSPSNSFFMPSKIEELQQKINLVALGEDHLTKDDQFAFAAGQILARISMSSEGSNQTFKYLEPFFRYSDADKFKRAVQEFFLRYSHKNYSNRFQSVSSEVLSYSLNHEFGEFEKLRPMILAGVFFRPNLLLSQDEKVTETPIDENN